MKPITLAGKDISHYNHVCAFFDSTREEYEVLSPFFRDGLENNEKTIHIVNPGLVEEHLQQLKSHGLDTDGCQACGQLEVLSWDDVYLADGRFDQDRMVGAIDAVIAAGQQAGYAKMRIMGNMGWTLKGCPGTDEVIEFESRVNEVLSRTKQMAICVYDMSKVSGALMMDILRSHPLTLIGSVIHENPFYTPSEQLVKELRARRLASPAATSANI